MTDVVFTLTHSRAGVTDSELTSHGFLQAEKLGQYLASRHQITHLFSSDLQRAHITAKQVWSGQRRQHGKPVEALRIRKLGMLRERDFGSFELLPTVSKLQNDERGKMLRQSPNFQDVETPAAMARRMDQFLDEHLLPIILSPVADPSHTVAVVSHGMLLVQLWRCLLKRFALNSVSVSPSLPIPVDLGITLDKAVSWSNTGYLNLSISKQAARIKSAGITEILTASPEVEVEELSKPASPAVLYDWMLAVDAINSKEHLRGLKRTGGGLGSARHDKKQKQIDSFFKK